MGTLGLTGLLTSLAMGGGKKETPSPAKQTIQQVKEAVKIDASSRYVTMPSRTRQHAYEVRYASEEEQLYVAYAYIFVENPSTGTNQDEQHQELHCRGGEGVKALEENSVPVALDGWLAAYHCRTIICMDLMSNCPLLPPAPCASVFKSNHVVCECAYSAYVLRVETHYLIRLPSLWRLPRLRL